LLLPGQKAKMNLNKIKRRVFQILGSGAPLLTARRTGDWLGIATVSASVANRRLTFAYHGAAKTIIIPLFVHPASLYLLLTFLAVKVSLRSSSR